MAEKGVPKNGRDRLDEAMAMLIQNQASFLGRLSDNDQRHAENERRHAENERRLAEYERLSAERFARIEADLATVIRVLNEHGRVLERLPEAIREKIGFKPTA